MSALSFSTKRQTLLIARQVSTLGRLGEVTGKVLHSRFILSLWWKLPRRVGPEHLSQNLRSHMIIDGGSRRSRLKEVVNRLREQVLGCCLRASVQAAL